MRAGDLARIGLITPSIPVYNPAVIYGLSYNMVQAVHDKEPARMPTLPTTRRKPSPPPHAGMGLAPTRFKVSGLRPETLDLSDPQQYACARMVFFSRHVRPLAASFGEPLEDVFQECLCGLLRRQRSPGSRYDPTRASLASYLGVVFRSLVLHYRSTVRHLCAPDRHQKRVAAYVESRGLSVSDSGDELFVEEEEVGKRFSVEKVARAHREVREHGIFADGSVW